MSSRSHTVVDSPLGELVLVAEGDALAGLYMTDQLHRPPDEAFGRREAVLLGAVAEQLEEYFAGDRRVFDVPLALRGTPFQRTVWAALRDIPYGEHVSYGELAQQIGAPTAARAVGLANGHNPVGVVVPCHRVVGAGGALTGYGGGLERKRFLLDLEQGTAARRAAAAVAASTRG